jgi:sugar lactone lactonase YvrE
VHRFYGAMPTGVAVSRGGLIFVNYPRCGAVRGAPKLVRIDLEHDEVVRTILFEPDVALPTTYLNDVRFDLRRGAAGTAFITDSADGGSNGIIVADLDTGESWRRLHDHPSTNALTSPDLRSL